MAKRGVITAIYIRSGSLVLGGRKRKSFRSAKTFNEDRVVLRNSSSFFWANPPGVQEKGKIAGK